MFVVYSLIFFACSWILFAFAPTFACCEYVIMVHFHLWLVEKTWTTYCDCYCLHSFSGSEDQGELQNASWTILWCTYKRITIGIVDAVTNVNVDVKGCWYDMQLWFIYRKKKWLCGIQWKSSHGGMTIITLSPNRTVRTALKVCLHQTTKSASPQHWRAAPLIFLTGIVLGRMGWMLI